RSRRSCSTSNTSLSTMPAVYRQLVDSSSNTNVLIGSNVSCVNQNPIATSAIAVKTFGRRISWNQASKRDDLGGSVGTFQAAESINHRDAGAQRSKAIYKEARN